MIYKRGRAYWYKFRWHLKTADGATEYYVIRRPAKTRNERAAQRLEDEHRTALRHGDVHPNDPFPKPPAPVVKPATLREYAGVVLAHVELHKKASTVDFYEDCLKRIKKFSRLWDAPLSSINSDLIDAYKLFRRQARTGNTAWTINGELRTLRRILRYAMKNEVIQRAPEIECLPEPESGRRALTPQEETAYLSRASRTLYDAAVLGIETGLRTPSELFKVEWEHISADGLRVPPGGKSKKANRTVPLSPRALVVLDALRSSANGSRWVFPSTRNASGHLVTLGEAHKEACREAGIKRFPMYAWRHTFATRIAESQKVPPELLMEWLGHSSLPITMKYYVKHRKEYKKATFQQYVDYTEQQRAEAVPLASEKAQ